MHLFAYGTLIFPELMERVTGRTFRRQTAVLRGYARFRLKDASSPALVPFPDTETDGVVYFDLDADTARRVDRFEGDAYRRVQANVETEGGEWVEAETYVLRAGARKRLTAEPWDDVDFRLRHLPEFLARYPKPVRR
jgi:gamma-glutamylcyclotransferase (GGCT)/AIG2-like uncharacterized protein YtfP